MTVQAGVLVYAVVSYVLAHLFWRYVLGIPMLPPDFPANVIVFLVGGIPAIPFAYLVARFLLRARAP